MKENMETICGVDCKKCEMHENCKGCMATNGCPYGGECVIANCAKKKRYKKCSECLKNGKCEYKEQVMKEFNNLGIKDMPKVTELYQLNGAFINMEYVLPSMQKVKFFKDNNIYLGTQLRKQNSDRCYGLTADDNYLLVCEYGENGKDVELIVFKKR